MSGIKIDPLDKLFSDYIRTRDGWECQRCLWLSQQGMGHRSVFRPPKRLIDKFPQYDNRSRNAMGLHNMHCFSRKKNSVRWNEKNCLAGCYGCHSYLDRHPKEKYAFFKEILGEKEFENLERTSELSVRGIDRVELKDKIKAKLEKLL